MVVLITPTSASLAGFALTFALSVSNDLLFVVRRWVQLQQALVGVERKSGRMPLHPGKQLSFAAG